MVLCDVSIFSCVTMPGLACKASTHSPVVFCSQELPICPLDASFTNSKLMFLFLFLGIEDIIQGFGIASALLLSTGPDNMFLDLFLTYK